MARIDREVKIMQDERRSPLERITAAREVSELANEIIFACTVAAREAGYSWSEIGEALHISPQAAQQRFRDR